ncbi:IS66 family insertion sequence element accessory protein TnpB [Bradyrhizobium sp. USDA 3315]
MHVEAMNWSGMGHAEYTAALGLSPDSLKIRRDRLEDSGDEMDRRLLLHPGARAQSSSAAYCARRKHRLTAEALDGRSNRRRFSNKQKRAIVQQTEKPGVSVAQVYCRHGVATGVPLANRSQGTATRDGDARRPRGQELPALAALPDMVQPPDGMMALELADGRRVFAPAGSTPAVVMPRLAVGRDAVSSQVRTTADSPNEEQWQKPERALPTEPNIPSCLRPSRVKLLRATAVRPP